MKPPKAPQALFLVNWNLQKIKYSIGKITVEVSIEPSDTIAKGVREFLQVIVKPPLAQVGEVHGSMHCTIVNLLKLSEWIQTSTIRSFHQK